MQIQIEYIKNLQKYFRIFIHPEYSATALTNDVAVLVLQKPIIPSETVSQVRVIIVFVSSDRSSYSYSVLLENIIDTAIF